MSFLEGILPFFMDRITEETSGFAGSFLLRVSQSMSNDSCGSSDSGPGNCQDSGTAFVLKMVAIGFILIAGASGVSFPLIGNKRRFLQTDSNLFVAAKAFAGGVILATGFVHMLPDATENLTDACLPDFPWSKFPFSGFIAMMSALATLVVDFVGTQYYERKQEKQSQKGNTESLEAALSESAIAPVEIKGRNGMVFGEEEGGTIHIVGMHAHAAHHRHNHSQEVGACQGRTKEHSHGHSHSHSHSIGHEDDENGARHVVVSQVLELGIVSHSMIIGLSLGVSKSQCTIRPLIAALSFHQFFEGFALGGCISQAQFRTLRVTLMAMFFAITTPLGIAAGLLLSSFYNPNSPRAMVVEGIFDSISAGILVYMALVDLIAADFLSKKMSCNTRLQIASYFCLFLGALLMSCLAIWA
ncbi:unnamed protein product [Cuscuta campestris]|uniref:Uncharacterized protein n=1 Tax=Cuscuta campestris TaxID=132261 RepID=A0A484M0B8_9ASTE|nr:unnamed protein product [Cuscuta campestris]